MIMSQNVRQNQNSRTATTMPVKIVEPMGDVSPDDSIDVTPAPSNPNPGKQPGGDSEDGATLMG
jgi:hypothetical protein